MSEIYPTDTSGDFSKTTLPSDLFPSWEKEGKIIFDIFGLIGAAALVPNTKRKRHITSGPIPNNQTAAPPNIEMIISETPIPPNPCLSLRAPTSNSPPICKEEEKEDIRIIFTAMGTKSYLELATIQSDLNKRGEKIAHLHPFQLLSVIFSETALIEHMKVIMQSELPWPFEKQSPKMRFLKGIGDNLARESQKNNIEPHLQNFSENISLPVEEIRQLIQDGVHEQLVFRLIEKNDGPRAQKSQE